MAHWRHMQRNQEIIQGHRTSHRDGAVW